jgi:hypothetical protein
MDTMDRLLQISSRLEHLENSAEWIAKDTIHTNNAASQTATLITALTDDIREKIYELVHELEQNIHEMAEAVKYH